MERTYVFNSDGNSGGARYDINAMLPGLMGRGIDPGVLALMNGNGGFGGQNGIWGVIYLAIVASIFGWNNGGFGGFGSRGANGLPAELAGNAGRELLMQAIQGNASAINQIASTLNCSSQQIESALCNIQNSVGLTGTQIINAIQSGNNSVLNQLSSCCCNMLQSIERQGYESRLATCEQTHTLVDTANTNASVAGQNRSTHGGEGNPAKRNIAAQPKRHNTQRRRTANCAFGRRTASSPKRRGKSKV